MTQPGKPPTSDAEWARNTERRVAHLESPNTVRIGPWVISSQDGDLIATKPGEEIVFGTVPEQTEVPDVTRGYISTTVNNYVELIEESIGNPNGGGGLPKIKDFLNGKWDDLVETQEVADSRMKAGNNLVTNPSFNKPIYYVGDGSYVTDIKRTGTQAARLVANGTLRKLPLICDTEGPVFVTATAGDIFYVEAWVWGASGNSQTSGGANGIQFYVYAYDKDGNQISVPLTTNGVNASTGLNNQWTRFYGYIAIPTTGAYTATASMTAYLVLNTNVTSGSVFTFDDPILRADSLVNSWNYIYDGANGTTGSFGKLPFDLLNPIQNLRQTSIAAASGASGAMNTALAAASGASGARSLAQDTIDAIVIGLKAWTGIDLAPGDVQTASEKVSTALATLSTVTSNLVAQREAGMFYGVAINESFTDYTSGSTLGAKWSGWASGTGSAVWGIDTYLNLGVPGTGYAMMKPVSGASSRTAAVKLVEQSLTQYQRIGIVFNDIGHATESAPSSGTRHWTRILGRINADKTQYVFVEFRATEVIIGFNNGSGGDQYWSGSLKTYSYKAGVPYWFECGLTQSAERSFKLWEGTTAITTAVDSSLASAVSDDGHCGAGFAGWITDHRYVPAAVAGFTLLDNVPPFIRGMGFRASNLTDSDNFQVDVTNSTPPIDPMTGFFPDNWFVQEYCTGNMLYTESDNTLTVSEPGHYLVVIAQKGSYAVQGIGTVSGRVSACIYVDSGSGEFIERQFYPSTQWSNIKESFGGVFTVYLQGGDKIRPGWKSWWETSGNSYMGSTVGETYFGVTFLHNRYEKVTSV